MNRSNSTTYLYTNKNANVFNQSTTTNTVPTNSSSTTPNDMKNHATFGPLRVSGLIILCLTVFAYIALHLMAAKYRQQRKRLRRRQSVARQRILTHNSNKTNIACGDNASQKSNDTPPRQPSPQERQFSTKLHEERLTNASSSFTPSSPLVTATVTPIVSGMVHTTKNEINIYARSSSGSGSSSSNNNNDNSRIPNTVLAKTKKLETLGIHADQNNHQSISSGMNTAPYEAAIVRPHDEQRADQNNDNYYYYSNTMDRNHHHLTNTNVHSTYNDNVGTTSMDDDEVLFYEQTLQYSHHGQRENITLHIPIDDDDYDGVGHTTAGGGFAVSSVWVSTEDSFLVTSSDPAP